MDDRYYLYCNPSPNVTLVLMGYYKFSAIRDYWDRIENYDTTSLLTMPLSEAKSVQSYRTGVHIMNICNVDIHKATLQFVKASIEQVQPDSD